MTTAIQEFCNNRKITKSIESAFLAYCKTSYALRFELHEGDTVSKIVANLTPEQVLDAWNRFVLDFKDVLLSK